MKSTKAQAQKYRNKKTKEVHALVKTTTDQERGYTYFYLERDGVTMAYGKKIFEELFEVVGDEV